MLESQLKEQLTEALKGNLPGLEAQLKLASMRRLRRLEQQYDTTGAKRSAVLVPIYPAEGREYKLVLMKRPEYPGVHSGQISFPGGQVEDNDSSLIHTALREAEEEVNIQSDEVEVLGEMTELYIPPSNFLVQPVVGFLKQRPNLIAEKEEVAQILEIPLSFFLDESNIQEMKIDVNSGLRITTPAFKYEGHIIWGATAMMLSELNELIRSFNTSLDL